MYIESTLNYKLGFSGYPHVFEGYSNANWKSDNDEIKLTSGHVFIFGGAAVSCKSTKQTRIAKSTFEYEFIALKNTTSEAKWLRNLLTDTPVWTRPIYFIFIHYDCQAASA